ncbi:MULTISPECIES: homoserine kinase [unclassified Pseudomonas]|jgi:homoserine kinase type II|uniref:homoserine kinase n=1 Tax=Pseudomonas TaxID=286 RepID=UPI000DAC5578|nr:MULTISPECIES: homoserine kinase [unclassified Pseudomonas]PZW84989.1 homoserine kinase [Pseudomonas sp. 2848]QWA28521.1 homoserine kinase [Pseudomonas sp. RC3H12]
MSVFTPVSRPELETFLAPYELGRLLDFQGIAAGTENSNFFVSLEKGEFVLTLIERGPAEDMPFFIELLDVLHDADMPVPYALRDREGHGLRELCGKPALLQPRLSGKHVKLPNNQHCAQVGELLAHIHLATRERIIERRTDRGLDWMLESGAELLPSLNREQAGLLQPALAEITAHKAQILALPKANLHADLFRDNVMFEGTHLTGLIDFYNACSGPMLYDIAITVNDWCLDEQSGIDLPHAQALLGAYAALRPFTAAEAELWPVMLRVACVRFWLSRLIAAQAFAGMDVMIHDPSEFEVRLAQRQQVALKLPFAL